MALPVLSNVELCLLSLLSFLAFFLLVRRRPAPNLLPPSPPKLPIIGNLHQLGPLPHRSLRALSDKHGPLMLLHLGRIPTLIVSSSDATRDILKNHDTIFSSRPSFKVGHALLYGMKDMAFAPYGDYWKQSRKLCVTHLLSNKMVQSFGCMREEEVELMINNIGESAGVVDMSEVLNSFANGFLCRVVSGKFSREGENVLRGLIEEATGLFGAFHVGDYLPYLGWADVFFGLNARCERNSKGWDGVLDEVIRSHGDRQGSQGEEVIRSHGDRQGSQGEEMDFVDVLLSLQKNPDMDFKMTEENIKALLVDMFTAGTDPPYIVLEWAMAELVRHPEIMQKLQKEVRGIASGKVKVREEELTEMTYLKAVIKEVMRLHPPAPLLIPRESMEDCAIHGYRIPEKSRVIINAWAISRDPKLWEAPDEFRPERFINSCIDFKGNDYQYIPFGTGRRICPGMNFSMAITELALANLVKGFEWELPDGMAIENLDMSEAPGLVTRRQQKLVLVGKPYSC